MTSDKPVWGDGHEFEEDVNDASMCMCGVPALVHDRPQGRWVRFEDDNAAEIANMLSEGGPDWPEVVREVHDKHNDTVSALVSALERTEHNFILAVNGKPVRDMAENLAENRAALEMAARHRY